MSLSKTYATIIVALITTAGALLGNLVTAFGPSVLSYYQKPRFVDTPAYRRLREDNPGFEAKLKEQLADAKAVIKSRDAEFRFERRVANDVVIRLTQRSEIQNVTSDAISTKLRITMQGQSRVEEATIAPSNGNPINFNKASLDGMHQSSKAGSTTVEIPYNIDGMKSVKITTVYSLVKPLAYMEPLVVDKVLTGKYDIIVSADDSLKNCLTFANESFAFDSPIPIETKPNGTIRMTLSGPLLPGQGLGVSWVCKARSERGA